jgi:hypothetical protein
MWNNFDKKLLKAARTNNTAMIGHCLDNGAQIDCRDDGMTPLLYAAYKGNYESVALLLGRGANVHITDSYNRTPLFWACSHNGNSEIARLLLEHNDSVLNTRSVEGYTPLMAAAANGNLPAVELLLTRKPDLYVKSNDGLDARALAIKYEAAAVLRLLNAYESEFSGIWVKAGAQSAKRERRLDNGMLLTEYVDLEDKMYTSILSGDNGQISHNRQTFNSVSRKMIADAGEAVRRLPAPPAQKTLPKPSTGF